jgi:hypothetical protein
MQLALPVCDHDFLSTVVSQLQACRLQQQSVAQRVVCNCIAYQATVSAPACSMQLLFGCLVAQLWPLPPALLSMPPTQRQLLNCVIFYRLFLGGGVHIHTLAYGKLGMPYDTNRHWFTPCLQAH